MTLRRVPAFTMIAIVWLGVQAEAQTPCPELVRLRNAGTEAWKEAMRVPPSERCGALYHASLAAEATLKHANNPIVRLALSRRSPSLSRAERRRKTRLSQNSTCEKNSRCRQPASSRSLAVKKGVRCASHF